MQRVAVLPFGMIFLKEAMPKGQTITTGKKMQNQKLENLLNLSLSATEEERKKSLSLSEGYNSEQKTWELIVKYSGSLEELREHGIAVEEMIGGYAILTVPTLEIDYITSFAQIEYVEKPKKLFFALNQAKGSSCINKVQEGNFGLTGKGILVAIIDSGIDYFHDDFRNEDGTTRIIKLWDQTLNRVFTRDEINEALAAGSRARARLLVPSTDISGHGTAVAGIAAGNGREENGKYRGIAYESELLVVKLGVPRADGFPRTTELMRAANSVVNEAVQRRQPIAVNLSFGNTYGSHDGTSLIETFLNHVSNYGRSVFVVGTGNEGVGDGHSSGRLSTGQRQEVELSVGAYQTSFSVQLWKSYMDTFDISLITPSGESIGPISSRLGPQTIAFLDMTILLYYGKPSPYSVAQEIYLDFIPAENYVNEGLWRIQLIPVKIVEGNFDFWLPSSSALSRSTRFLRPSPQTTLTIPSTAAAAISVGAYDDAYQSFADFSGRGYTRSTNLVKPDLVAPGVSIITSRSEGGYEAMTGTSFATPFVTGSAALLMQWGIVDGNDPYLYGEKVKAYLRRGAKHLPGYLEWPNPQLGFGALCLTDSIPL